MSSDFVGLRVIWPPDGTRPLKHDQDVIFVHGLHHGSVSQWRDKEGVCWPAEHLSLDLENARILAFGYDSTTPNVRSDGLYRGGLIFKQGEDLWSQLKIRRRSEKTQVPITLVGHDIGAIVIKSALCISLTKQEDFDPLLRKTKQIFLFESPPADLDWEVWKQMSEQTPNAKSKGQWKVWSAAHESSTTAFDEIACYFKVTTFTSKFDDFVSTPDHRVIVHKLRDTMPIIISDPGEAQRILSWLERQEDDINMDSHQRNVAKHLLGTGEWLFQETMFRKWTSLDKASPIIWLVGPEGCGKSVICSLAVERMRQTPQEQAVVNLMIALDKPRSEYYLVTQIAMQLLDYVIKHSGGVDAESLLMLPRENVKDKKTFQIQDLIRVLISQCPAVFIFIDGMDEVGLAEENDRTVHMKADLDKTQRPLHSVVSFIAEVTREELGNTPVRLWCSSKHTIAIGKWMQELGALELPMNKHAVAADVARFIEHRYKDGVIASENLRKATQNNFLLASMLADARGHPGLLTHHLGEPSQRDPSTSIRKLYQKQIDRVQRSKSTVSEDVWELSLHAWHIISLVTYAKRPLRMLEIQEALATLQGTSYHPSTTDSVLTAVSQWTDNHVQHECWPFIEFHSTDKKGKHHYWRVAHASAFKYLRECSEKAMLKGGERLVNSKLIAEICLRCLSQLKYRNVGSRSMHSLSFYAYAAKYWHRHVEEAGADPQLLQIATEFMKSAQFLTMTRFQSRFLNQHFNSHPTSSIKSVHEDGSSPDWARISQHLGRIEGLQHLVDDYEHFINEWSDYLQLGTTCSDSEVLIENCFWGALGAKNALRISGSAIEENQSFLLTEEPVERDLQQREHIVSRLSFFDTISDDGNRISVWQIPIQSDDDTEASIDGKVAVLRDSWYIDGDRPPFRYGAREELSIDNETLQVKTHLRHSPRDISLIPTQDTISQAPRIFEDSYGSVVRIGRQFYDRKPGRIWTEDRSRSKNDMVSWDSISFREPWTIHSHRKQHGLEEKKANSSGSSERGVEQDIPLPPLPIVQAPVKEPEGDTDSDVVSVADKEVDPMSAEDGSSSEEKNDSITQASQSNDNTSQEEFDSDSGVSAISTAVGDSLSSAEELFPDPPSDLRTGTESPDILWSSASEEEMHSEESNESAASDEESTDNDGDVTSDTSRSYFKTARKRRYRLINKPSRSMSAEASDADDEESVSGSKARPTLQEAAQPKHIFSLGLYCDLCSATIVPYSYRSVDMKEDRYYQCITCANTNCFDICSTCFGKGAWCKDPHHFLSECLMDFSERRFYWRDGISRNTANPLVKIVARGRNPGLGDEDFIRSSFRYNRRQSTMLHTSQPVTHPLLPLIIYPLDGRRLLFGNLEMNTYFDFEVPFQELETAETGLSTCIPISIELRFSPCGRIVHMLRFTARSDSLMSPIDLRAVLFTIALSSKDPCSGTPRILSHHQSSNLGTWPRIVSRLPYTVTWKVPHVYIAMSTGFLEVLRFDLYIEQRKSAVKEKEVRGVYAFSTKVAMPRSARFRSIHFLPGNGNASNKVILGSLHGEEPQPPIVVYIKGSEQEEWSPRDASSRKPSTRTPIRPEALLEDPFWDEDADLVAKATIGDGAPILEPVMPIREQLQRQWQTKGIYCPSCFELGIKLGFFRPHPKIQFQYLDFVPTAANAVKLEWRVAPSVFLEALKNGCQFCCYVALRTLNTSHIRHISQSVGSGGVRCCSEGSAPERPGDIQEIINNINKMSWKIPRENQEFKFLCEPQHWSIETRSFDKLIITLPSVQVGGKFGEKGFAPTMVTVRGNNELGETSTITTFIHTPEISHRGTPECVLELYAPSNDYSRHLIDTRPLTTSRGEGDNLEVVKSWLHNCQSDHAFCRQRDNVKALLPSRLVEIIDGKVIRLIETAREVGRYVALSYCWGRGPSGSTMTESANLGIRLGPDGLLRANLPATIKDAITVTERLGIKYIWIDSLCIVQDDRQDKHAELGKMSQYYRNSFLTIAASTPSATTGFIGKFGRCEKHPESPLPRDLVPLDVMAHVHDSKDSGVAGKIYVREENPYQLHEEPINKRAWTLQECILAPRVLLFGSRVIWFCQHMTHSDGGIEDWSFDQNDLEGTRREFQVQLGKLERGVLESSMAAGGARSMNETRTDYKLWHRLVGTYSRRALSYAADKLPAISAVAAEYAKLANDTYLAGLWRLNLPRDLLWTTAEATTHRSKTWRAPTWSWASVDDAILYKQPPPDNATLLADVLEVEAVPLTEVAPFGEVKRGSLVISAPSFTVTIKDEESREKFSEPWLKDFKMRPGKSERDMLLDSLKNFVDSTEEGTEGGEKKNFQLPDEFVVLFIYGKRDELFRSNEVGLDLNDTTQRWSMWGLILTQVAHGLEKQLFERVLSFSQILVTTDDSLFSGPKSFRII